MSYDEVLKALASMARQRKVIETASISDAAREKLLRELEDAVKRLDAQLQAVKKA